MNRDWELKLQAYVDGELSSREARQVQAWVAEHPESHALLDLLRSTRDVLRENEPVVSVPEGRDFYWSKIHRAIQQAGPEPEPLQPAFSWWQALRQYLAPLAGTALVAFLALGVVRMYSPTRLAEAGSNLSVVENLSDHVESVSFHHNNMFVIWLSDRDQQQEASDTEVVYEEIMFQ